MRIWAPARERACDSGRVKDVAPHLVPAALSGLSFALLVVYAPFFGDPALGLADAVFLGVGFALWMLLYEVAEQAWRNRRQRTKGPVRQR